MRGLVVEDKWKRVRNYQSETLKDFLELFAAAGCSSLDQLNRKMVYKQLKGKVKSYEQLYPTVHPGSYLKTTNSSK